MTTATAPARKRCPGFGTAQAPHELPATLANFHSNRGSKDGLSARCRSCGNAYGTAWAAAKKRGEQFTLHVSADEQAERAPGVAQAATEGERAERAAKPPSKPSVLAVREVAQPAKYGSDLAVRVARGKVGGYSLERVGDTDYALPVHEDAVGSDEGQAALDLVNQARAVERRRRDAERKRTERAAKKEATAQA